MRLSILATVAVVVGVASAIAVAAGPPAPAPAAPPDPSKANPCAEVKNCNTIEGPWVAVPATGEANFLLECPKRAGTIGGTDALASSSDVRVVWEGNPGSPVRPGTTTVFFAFFRASSAHGRPGAFRPYIGCIPPQKANPRARVSARITHPGNFLDRRQSLLRLKPGATQIASQDCGKGERLLDGWYAVVFATSTPPGPALGSKVRVTLVTVNDKIVATAHTEAGMPASALAQLQVGAVCAK